MGNLEGKLMRLTPDLLREVEDYVDYLLEHRGNAAVTDSTTSTEQESNQNKPIIFAQESQVSEPPSQSIEDISVSSDKLTARERDPKKILEWID